MPTSKPKAVLLFDGDCGFCRYWVERWKLLVPKVLFEPFQDSARRPPSVSAAAMQRSVFFVEGDLILSGARAVFTLWSRSDRWWKGIPIGLYEHAPPFRWISEAFYRLVAGNRVLFSRLTRIAWGKDPSPPSRSKTISLFLSGLGMVYFFAFASLWGQIPGLMGEHGILPAGEFQDYLAARMGWGERIWNFPTLSWISASDGFLMALAAMGTGFAALLFFRRAVRVSLVVCWLAYLSLTHAGGEFMAFQWESLLIETGFLSFFLVVWSGKRASVTESVLPLFLLRLLLFRLLFFSGIGKLTSGDPAWKDWTAMNWHFFTQPIPNPIAFFMHQLPHGVIHLVTGLVLLFEVVLPWLIFFPRRLRAVGAMANLFFQGMIIATGNYGYFNYLALILNIPLLDDRMIPGWPHLGVPLAREGRLSPFRNGFCALILVVTAAMFLVPNAVPRWITATSYAFRILGHYAPFTVMTKRRDEILIEGSRDGKIWEPYIFRWKPQAPDHAPPFLGPHMPRLDWQMWFAALRTHGGTPWLRRLEERLLQGRPEVMALFQSVPFSGEAPLFIRTRIQSFEFTSLQELHSSGNWWSVGAMRSFGPIVSKPD